MTWNEMKEKLEASGVTGETEVTFVELEFGQAGLVNKRQLLHVESEHEQGAYLNQGAVSGLDIWVEV